jgi:CTP synthase
MALFCNVEPRGVIAALDAESIYEVPLLLKEQGLDDIVMERLGMPESPESTEHSLDAWIDFVKRLKNPKGRVKIGLVGKYVEHQDAYKSISESFVLAGVSNDVSVDIKYILSDELNEQNAAEELGDVAGVLVAPGFGDRGIDGKLAAVRYAREQNIPFLGICLGMQCAVIEFARNVCGWPSAHSTEFDAETTHPVIDIMEEQKRIVAKGGTMRLGAYDCHLTEGSKVREIYGVEEVRERHRHRYEVNNVLRYKLLERGIRFAGMNIASDLVEIIELPEHRWFVGVQFHPEYKSSVGRPHPLFKSFVEAAVAYAREKDMVQKPRPPRREKVLELASAKV